jgi:hypothetical protein
MVFGHGTIRGVGFVGWATSYNFDFFLSEPYPERRLDPLPALGLQHEVAERLAVVRVFDVAHVPEAVRRPRVVVGQQDGVPAQRTAQGL